jgi:hypothetical protein
MNMRKLFLVFFLFPMLCDAQGDSLRFGFGGGFSIDRTYRSLKADGADESLKENFDTLETSDLGFSIQFACHYKLTERIDITSGLGFARRGVRIDTLTIADTKDLIDRFSFVEIPLGIRYSFLEKEKYTFHLGAGVFASYLLKHNGRFQELRRETEYTYSNTDDYNKTGVGAFGTLGFAVDLNERFALLVDASYRQSLTQISEGTLSRKLNAAGLGISIIHDF